MTEKTTVLKVENLSVTFTQYEFIFKRTFLKVIRDMNLEVRQGEVVAVVGSSGSGKSLLAHAVLGLLPENASISGEISYRGEPLTREAIGRLRGHEIVLIPQSVSYLDPLMRTGQQIRRSSKSESARVNCASALSRYGLEPETENLFPFELSGGMARRVLMASAVMENPRLVIADEPTPGLHAKAAGRVLGHFREMADQGAGVLFITHDLNLALECADRVAVFYGGTNVEEALVTDFESEEKLRHPYTKALYRAMPEHGFAVTLGNQPYVKSMPEGCPYGPRCHEATEDCLREVTYVPLRSGMVRCIKSK